MGPEILFQPCLVGSEMAGLSELTLSCVSACSADVQHQLLSNIIMVGGNTMIRGMDKRLWDDLQIKVGDSQVKVVAPPERNKSVWLGGSILASLSFFSPMFITRREYEESGPAVVHRKCPINGINLSQFND